MLIPSSLKFQTFIANYQLLLILIAIRVCSIYIIQQSLQQICNYEFYFIISATVAYYLQQSNIKSMKESKQNKPQQKPDQTKNKSLPKFYCGNKREAMYCCAEPKCNKLAVKCVGSNTCPQCKNNHVKCPRQIKIQNVFDRAETIIKRSPLQSIQIKPEDQIQRLIKQLKKIKQDIAAFNIREWGLSNMFLDLLYNRSLQDKTGHIISDFVVSQPIYPNKRFYKPEQFVKDVDIVYKINQKLKARSLTIFLIYKRLALIDCSLKVIQRRLQLANKQKPGGKVSQFQLILQTIKLSDLQNFHNQLRLAIMERLAMEKIFAGIQIITTKQEISDFRDIGKRLFNLTLQIMERILFKKQFDNSRKLIGLNFDLFNQDRKQFGLARNQFNPQIQRMEYCLAIMNYWIKNYKPAYEYFLKQPDDKYDDKKLKVMIDIIQKIKDIENRYEMWLKYLLLLYDFDKNNQRILYKIIECYTVLKNQERIYFFMRKLNTLLKQRIKNLQSNQFLKYLQRECFCIKYEESIKNYVRAMTSITQVLALISEYEHLTKQIIEIELKLIHDFIKLQRLQRSAFNAAASKGVQKCKNYLDVTKNKMLQNLKLDQKYIFTTMVKQYLMKFLVFLSETTSNKHLKYPLLSQAFNLSNQLKLKIFQITYGLAKLSYQIQKNEALQFQDRSNQIYPTDVCYRQKAFILYSHAFLNQSMGTQKLQQCIQAAIHSQTLNPLQPELFYLKGLAYQNLKKYKQSNVQFQKAKSSGSHQLEIDRRIAENNQFIIKSQKDPIKSKQLLDVTQKIYQKCVNTDPNNKKSILGYARVLKLQKKPKEAEFQFEKLIDTEFKIQAFMYLGNLKQEKALQNDDRDFDLLDQALELYKKAGKIKQNQQNMIRIYRELDRQRQADKIQAQNDWR